VQSGITAAALPSGSYDLALVAPEGAVMQVMLGFQASGKMASFNTKAGGKAATRLQVEQQDLEGAMVAFRWGGGVLVWGAGCGWVG